MTGRRQDHLSQFNLSPSEVIDIVAESAQRGNITSTSMMGRATSAPTRPGGAATVTLDTSLQRAVTRECPGVGDVACRGRSRSKPSLLPRRFPYFAYRATSMSARLTFPN